MEAWLAVIDELLQFVWQQFSGSIPAPVVEPVPVTAELMTVTPPTVVAAPVAGWRVGERYFVGAPNTRLHLDPVIGFDNVAATLPYGQMVRLNELRGRWAAVQFDDHTGWLLKDALVARRIDVYPQLQAGHHYAATDHETSKLRAIIRDCFSGAADEHPLTAAEYVTYRLQQAQRQIAWGTIRRRTAGTWQRKLRGVPGVHMSVQPTTGSAMEYVRDEVGFLAYVDAVYPDGSIKVSMIGHDDDGLYSETELSLAAWKELRPVFISVQ